jgi:phosphonopyruvate decarboxylase
MMKRDECFRALARAHTDEIVVAVYQSGFDWRAIKPWPLNYFCTGVMGQAVSHALGLALGRPDKRVIVLDGDGSLLMNLGALVTVAETAPRNLVHFVCENGTYEVNGAHPIPGRGRISFAGMARAAGIPRVYEFDELTAFEARVAGLIGEPGPVFATLKLEPGAAHPRDYDYIHSAEHRRTFHAALRGA